MRPNRLKERELVQDFKFTRASLLRLGLLSQFALSRVVGV